jgi:hypothetical protein
MTNKTILLPYIGYTLFQYSDFSVHFGGSQQYYSHVNKFTSNTTRMISKNNVTWMARTLPGNGSVNIRDTCWQQWNEVMQPAFSQRSSK